MCITSSFKRGFQLFKKNFWTLISLCFSRLAVALGIGVVGILLILPSMYAGLAQIFANPNLLLESPFALQYASYFFFYVLLMIGLFVVLMPLLAFPHVAGAVLSTQKKNISFKSSFELLKEHYSKLLVDGIIYTAITTYLLLQSVFLFLAYPFLGFVFFMVALYISVKLAFWDILTLHGEKHPLRASWQLTSGQFWTALAFIGISNLLIQLVSLLPILGILLGIILIPFISTAKAVFVKELQKKPVRKSLKESA
ncbi:MAG: hypothetical protein GOU98_03785 [Candidatus Altiarchaeota archaeon]|nr:hypothetical protein [Candidatus Altiarchaeota archaeon]